MSYKNFEDQQKYQRGWYNRNKEKKIRQIHDRKRRIAEWLLEYKSKLSCSNCNYDFNGREKVCDFHHIDGDKEGLISRAANRGWGLKKLKKEIDKCVPLCANCHRLIHQEDNESIV